MKKNYLIIRDNGDPSVGIFATSFQVEIPFSINRKKLTDTDRENLNNFKRQALELYSVWCDGKCTAYYEFE